MFRTERLPAPLLRLAAFWPDAAKAGPSPLIPVATMAGRSLVALVAVMTFLAALTVGAVSLVRGSAAQWEAAVMREATVQLRPLRGRDMEADLKAVAEAARKVAGVGRVQVLARAETDALVTPWLGAGLDLSAVPVPRMVVIARSGDASLDVAALAQAIRAVVPHAMLDDHVAWSERMAAAARAVALAGLAGLVLMLTATVLAIIFAARAAMATNRQIIEVLDLVGAEQTYIANLFQGHFLRHGLIGAAFGGTAAIVAFGLLHVGHRLWGSETSGIMGSLLADFALSVPGYAGIIGVCILVASLAAIAARATALAALRPARREDMTTAS
jgi:cell division transport system permease protein